MMMILLMLAVPLCGAVVTTLCARRSEDLRDALYRVETLLVFALGWTASAASTR